MDNLLHQLLQQLVFYVCASLLMGIGLLLLDEVRIIDIIDGKIPNCPFTDKGQIDHIKSAGNYFCHAILHPLFF